MGGGDSAGGNLAIAVCLRAKDDAIMDMPAAQFLLYPSVDASNIFNGTYPSEVDFGSTRDYGFADIALIEEILRWTLRSPEDVYNPLFSPMRAPDLHGLPPSVIITAGFDPLRDAGKAFADRLKDAGIEVEYFCATSLNHGFIHASATVPSVIPLLKKCCNTLMDILNRRKT